MATAGYPEDAYLGETAGRAPGRLRRRWRLISGPRGRNVTAIAVSVLVTGAVVTSDIINENAAAAIRAGLGGLIGSAALIWRRRHPLLVTAVGAVVVVFTAVFAPAAAGLMTIGVGRRDRVLAASVALVALAFVLPEPGSGATVSADSVLTGVIGALFFALWGAYIGARRALLESLRERADRAERERELRAEQARLFERARIAREMHDVLAHKVSLIALQAGGLELNAGMGAERVEQTAALIRVTAREALEDLRGVLGVLRSEGNSEPGPLAPLRPQPGIADIEPLVASAQSAGVRVTARVHPVEVPDAVGRTAFRIIQESLTNAAKHAPGAAVEVIVRRVGGDLLVEVMNRRPVSAGSDLPGSGSGLVGLRERISVLGGDLRCAPTTQGGWRVAARLPVGPELRTEGMADPIGSSSPFRGRPVRQSNGPQ